ncbi:sec-independent protein translocase protein TatB isoform X2 [Carya illinoinensis]|uniref:Sec-independent protein translocase protein TatB n=1 Tax=Carya illinoinensis TaxID=32201 RepID=A0A8T1RFF9_CARIL|nr:sec-independent protein translocase protein TatB isoform X2 [Carya illinoinensis]KAG6664778.1 hypothetical protein CIPAW_02G117200 [Carya illinoinensis]KAG6664781.1 hypothetical protein CIPAW_02G117200 [Carya illinoinensis]KAG6664782.1 hypothetical protein CIPAW_02G117200 [Carya illinoinensis]KAG6727121.1 hypothetical protein I3842_02G115200 [Carya illinoinensis]KAG6727122.1 hypothetical protein I3842_02G115200 [Carya illinoinensis]
MFGISYGELFLLIGATAALVGPKDLPILARTAGRLAGRAIGYVQLARGQFDNVMQQSQARQVHKELQDTMAQLEVIRHEIRGISFINPGPLTRRLMDEPKDPASNMDSGNRPPDKCEEAQKPINAMMKDYKTSGFVDLHSQATAYARLAESETLKTGSLSSITEKENIIDESTLFTVLPISAESAGMLPDRKGSTKGSDIVLEAVLEAEVARNAKDFFSQPQNQIDRIDRDTCTSNHQGLSNNTALKHDGEN